MRRRGEASIRVPALGRGMMLKQGAVDPLEVIADTIKQVGGTFDDQVQKDEEASLEPAERSRRIAVPATRDCRTLLW